MHRSILLLLALLVLASAAFAQKTVVERIPLTHIAASDFVNMLKTGTNNRYVGEGQPNVEEPLLPPGILSVAASGPDNSVVIRGTAESIAQIVNMARLIDIRPRQAMIRMRLMRVRFTPDGKRVEDMLGAPIVTTVNNEAAEVRVTGQSGYAIQVTPRINGDDSISLFVHWNLNLLLPESTKRRQRFHRGAVQLNRRVPIGETLRLGMPYFPESGRPAPPQSKPLQGVELNNFNTGEPGTLYYLEMSPIVVSSVPKQPATP